MSDPGSKRRIFLLDEQAAVRDALALLVGQQPDLRLCGAGDSGRQARAAIVAQQPDVVVMDTALPDVCGIKLISDVKCACPRLAVLVLARREDAHYAARVLRAGARGYVAKREGTGTILAAIREVLAGRLFVRADLASALAAQYIHGSEPGAAPPIEQLSDREFAVFELLGRGWSTSRIAEELDVSAKTIQADRVRIKAKYRFATSTELLREAVCWQQTQET
jgi:DNA-binding NarL/FixJ family response regulator